MSTEKRTGPPLSNPYADRDVRERVIGQIRLLTVESQKVGQAFAAAQGLRHNDFEALVHVLEREGAGDPMTPGELARVIGLTSGATTYLIDRLEREGHIRRDRSRDDRRKVHLRYGDRGRAVAGAFFQPLGVLADAVMDDYDDTELAVVERFVSQMSQAFASHHAQLAASTETSGGAGRRSPRPQPSQPNPEAS